MTRDEPIGVIAGGGRLPILLARESHRAGRRLVVVSIVSEPEPGLSAMAHVFEQVPVGKIASILKVFEREGVRELAILGGVRKEELFRRRSLDPLALKILAKTRMRGDYALLKAMVEEFASRGFHILDQREYLRVLIPSAGVLTRRKPNRRQKQEAIEALELARRVAALDIGQTVVLKNGVPLAVEAIEGTDATIRRGALFGGENVIVAKATRPDHDFRFDVPTVGLDTMRTLCDVRAAMLVLEAERTFLLDRELFLSEAETAGILVLALS